MSFGTEDQALGHARAAQPGQPLRAARAGQQAERRLGQAESARPSRRRAGRRPAPARARRPARRRRSRPASPAAPLRAVRTGAAFRAPRSVISSGPCGVAKQARINARSAPAQNTRWSLRMCSSATPSSAITRSSTACSCAISVSSSALTGARDKVATSTRPIRSVSDDGAHAAHASARCSSCSLRRSSLPVGVRGSARQRVQPARPLVRRQRARRRRAGRHRPAAASPATKNSATASTPSPSGTQTAAASTMPVACVGEVLFELDQIDPAAVDLDQRILAAGKAPSRRWRCAGTGRPGRTAGRRGKSRPAPAAGRGSRARASAHGTQGASVHRPAHRRSAAPRRRATA